MDINEHQLKQASERGLIDEQQAQQLWAFLVEQEKTIAQAQPRFQLTHVLYYLGGCIAIAAMTVFMTTAWENFGGKGLMAIALTYAALALWLTEYFLRDKQLTIPAAICASFAVALTPLTLYGLQVELGFWNDETSYRDYHQLVDQRWLVMELATLVVGALLLWRYRLAFLVMPFAATLWYMTMDLAPLLTPLVHETFQLEAWVSVGLGLLISLLALMVDKRKNTVVAASNEQLGESAQPLLVSGDVPLANDALTVKDTPIAKNASTVTAGQDYAFWLYFFGVSAFWLGMTMQHSHSEFAKFGYFCLNLFMIILGAILGRKVITVYGALGSFGYLGYLAYDVFKDSLLFPFVLTLIGFGVIYLGILWQRHEETMSAKLRSYTQKLLAVGQKL